MDCSGTCAKVEEAAVVPHPEFSEAEPKSQTEKLRRDSLLRADGLNGLGGLPEG
jgi:hypothetical protein